MHFYRLICPMQVLDNLPHDLVYRETPKSPWLETWVVRNQTRSALAFWLSIRIFGFLFDAIVRENHAEGVPHSNNVWFAAIALLRSGDLLKTLSSNDASML